MIDYLRDPGEIYRRSFAAIRAETDLSRLPDELAPLALRIVHACGMPEIVGELKWSDGAPGAGRAALAAGAPILCDATMVAHGIVRRRFASGARRPLGREHKLDPHVLIGRRLETQQGTAGLSFRRPFTGSPVEVIDDHEGILW